jgi:hypothetical protein
MVAVGVGVGLKMSPTANRIELPTSLVSVEPLVLIEPRYALTLTKVEFPTCLYANKGGAGDRPLYDANSIAPDDKVKGVAGKGKPVL